jgi:hypothetical protein
VLLILHVLLYRDSDFRSVRSRFANRDFEFRKESPAHTMFFVFGNTYVSGRGVLVFNSCMCSCGFGNHDIDCNSFVLLCPVIWVVFVFHSRFMGFQFGNPQFSRDSWVLNLETHNFRIKHTQHPNHGAHHDKCFATNL